MQCTLQPSARFTYKDQWTVKSETKLFFFTTVKCEKQREAWMEWGAIHMEHPPTLHRQKHKRRLRAWRAVERLCRHC